MCFVDHTLGGDIDHGTQHREPEDSNRSPLDYFFRHHEFNIIFFSSDCVLYRHLSFVYARDTILPKKSFRSLESGNLAVIIGHDVEWIMALTIECAIHFTEITPTVHTCFNESNDFIICVTNHLFHSGSAPVYTSAKPVVTCEERKTESTEKI